MIKSGQDWAGIFATYDSDGSLKAPSSGPTGTLYIDGSSNSATVTITGSNPYKFSVTLPTLTAGQRVDMYITATISSIATAGIVASDQADTAYISNVKSDTADILADTGTDGVLISSGTGAKQIDLSSGKVLLQPTQTGVTIPTVTNLTNLPTMPTDWVTAAGIKADAVTKIQTGLATAAALAIVSGYVDDLETRLTAVRAGYLDKLNVTGMLANTDNANNFKADVSNLALEATLTAIKGSGWTNETLKAIKEYVDELESRLTAVRAGYLDNLTKLDANVSSRLATSGYTAPDNANILNIKAKTDNLPATPADEATLTAIKGAGWTDETLVALMTAIENISAGSGATPQEVWEYATRTLTGLPALPTDWVTAASLKADAIAEIQSGLATSAALQAVDDLVDDLESRLTAVRAGYLDKLNVAGTLANTSNADTFKADVTKLDATVSSRLAYADYTDPDNAGITAIRAKTDNLPATPADEATLTAMKGTGWTGIETLKAIKDYVDELETRLTAVRAAYLDKLNVSGTLANTDNASAFKADVSNLALEATLTAIKGSGWTNETLKAIKEYVDDLENRLTAARAGYLDKLDVSGDLANTANADTFKADVSDLALEATLEAIMGAGWTDETLVALMVAIEAISTGLGATPQQIWEYVSRTLTDASGLGLATSEELAEAVADIQGGQGDTLETMTYKINTIDNVVDTIYAEMGSAPEIADAVLDELLDDHTIDGSLGDAVADIAAKTNNLPDNPALDEVLIDTGTQQFTTADLIKIIAAKMVGKASGGGTTSIVYRNLEDSVDIIVETVDENGNRSDITLAP